VIKHRTRNFVTDFGVDLNWFWNNSHILELGSEEIGQFAYICGGLLHGGLGRICWFISLKMLQTSFYGDPNEFSAKSV